MNRASNWSMAPNKAIWIAAIIVIACLSAGAQTTPTLALTPAQQRAQARAAQQAAAKQAAEQKREAAQQAAETKRQAAQQAAQNRKAGTTTAATQKPGTAATNAATKLPASPASATSTSATAGTAYRPGNNKSTATTPANAGGTAVGSGTLAWGPRVYTSTGCTHNGNSAVCTFTFVNQGNEASLTAGGAGELSGIQLVDDAHVPHRWDGAHFMDKYGTQQPRLIVQQGDSGTYVVTFPNVNPQVTSAEFHLRNQIIGGVTFSGTQSTAAAGTTPAGAK